MNILEIINQYPTQEACIKYLENKKWGKEAVCPYCGSTNTYKAKDRLRHHCNGCRKSFSVTVGTIFHDSKIPLQKWFLAISLMLNAKKGLSSCQLARDLNIRQATAWSMLHRIRKAMKDDNGLLSGIVELDETYIGGKPRANEHRKRNKDDDDVSGGSGSGRTKECIFGMVERDGKVKAMRVEDSKRNTLMKEIYKGVECGSELMTDEYAGYHYLHVDYSHKTVCHSALEFVKGDCHTNTIEGFWSLLKRGIRGQFHHLSKKYIGMYIDEFCWRYNNKGNVAFDKLIQNCLFA